MPPAPGSVHTPCSGVPKPPLDLLIYPALGRPLLAS